MKNILLTILISFLFANCSKKSNQVIVDNLNDCKTYKFLELSSNRTVKNDDYILYSKEWDIRIERSSDSMKYFLKNKKILELNTTNSTLLYEEFDNKFLLISECQPNENVATNRHLKTNKLWIYDTITSKLYYSNLNGILLRSECDAKKVKSETHHVNSPYGLVTIETDSLELILLETIHKQKSLEILLVVN